MIFIFVSILFSVLFLYSMIFIITIACLSLLAQTCKQLLFICLKKIHIHRELVPLVIIFKPAVNDFEM